MLAATGIPFREAHDIISRGAVAASATGSGPEAGPAPQVHEVLNAKNVLGGTAPERVLAAAKAALETL